MWNQKWDILTDRHMQRKPIVHSSFTGKGQMKIEVIYELSTGFFKYQY